MADRVNGCAKRGAGAWVGDVGQLIVHPQTIAPCPDKACTSEVHQVPRDGWLWQPERLVDVANRHFAIRQDTQNPKSRRVGQRSVHPRQFMNPGHLAAKCTTGVRIRDREYSIQQPTRRIAYALSGSRDCPSA
jgi:hypothetical protein